MTHWLALLEDDYRPGDMAHPYRSAPWTGRMIDGLLDANNWIVGFMLALLFLVAVGIIYTS